MNKPIWAVNLRTARKLKELSQVEIDDKIFKSRGSFGKYERGLVEPCIETWLLLCDILAIDNLKRFWSEDYYLLKAA
jgi:transcriptional regulator with XRE-family HTH domain